MVISDKDYRPETQRFLRHYFFEKRFIFLEGPMTEDYTSDPTMPFGWSTSPRGVIDQILYLALEPRPIRLIINSPGGSVTSYLRLYDLMRSVQVPIYTIAMGVVASAAVPILAAGTPGKRFIFPHSKTMIHLPRGTTTGDTKDLEIILKEFQHARDTYAANLSAHSKKSAEEILALMDRDHWMTAEETITLGIADKVIHGLEDIALEASERRATSSP